MTQTSATAFVNALITRIRDSVRTGAQATLAPNVRSSPMFDPALIPAYRRRRLLARRSVKSAPAPCMEREI
jgi:hypothetical protein